MSIFSAVPNAPPDPIFGVKIKFDESKIENKQLLSVGVYQTEDAKPLVFSAVKKAEQKILHKNAKNYLPMTGDAKFVEQARKLLWGPVLPEIAARTGSLQSCAGTGGLFMIAEFTKNQLKTPKVLLSDPMWPNYKQIFGMHEQELYPWAKNCVFDLEGCLGAINKAQEGTLIVLQACAHNPTGVDPSPEEWKLILNACNARKLVVAFDFAYMGYGSGDMEVDAATVREYAKTGNFFFVSFSFSKNMGLYGERTGCLHVVCADAKEAKAVVSQLANVGRRSYSVCPQNGSYIAEAVLSDPELTKEWIAELKTVTERINNIRMEFVDLLEKKTGQSFEFLRKQRGMFALTGLTPEEVKVLGDEGGVFIPSDGRVSVPALNKKNVDFVAQAIANIVMKRK
jgi:aspartate/tyrosine/aromatic aminotransferase